jgi:P27 family predicted phage terminase small subunit
MKGRKPKPIAVKELEGNPGKRPMKPAAAGPGGPFDPPIELEGVARQEWDRILIEAPWLRASESLAIADRCICVARLLEAESDIAKRGTLVKNGGRRVTNPNVRTAREYRRVIMRYDSELGLTASSRSRLPDVPANRNRRAGTGPGDWRDDPIERALCGDD